MKVVLAALLALSEVEGLLASAPPAQDPADDLRRQELALRLEELAREGKFEALARAVQRELKGRSVDARSLDLCWKLVAIRRWDGELGDFVAAWDKAAAAEAPAPGPALFRARLESLLSKPKAQRERLEAAVKTFPAEPAILWHLARARFDAADHAGAASALEQLAPLQGYPFDSDEFHRMLALSYAQTDRRAAAVEHLRAIREEQADAVELATLALKCRMPEEAARFFRTALASDSERVSLRMGLIRALQDSGAEREARVERKALFTVNGEVSVGKIEDYFFLLPADGRVEEISRTVAELASPTASPEASKVFDAVAAKIPADDRARVAAAWETSAREARDWVMLARLKRTWASGMEPALEAIEKGEKLFPRDASLVREKLDLMERLYRPKGVAACFLRLAELEPEAPRPYGAAQRAIRQLAQIDSAEAIRLGVFILSEPRLDPAVLQETRAAMRPACELAGPSFWDEIRKLKLPAPDAKASEAVRTQLSRLSDDEFEVRSGAARELRKLGLPAIPALLERIDDPDIEVRSKAREIIRAILSE